MTASKSFSDDLSMRKQCETERWWLQYDTSFILHNLLQPPAGQITRRSWLKSPQARPTEHADDDDDDEGRINFSVT